MKDVLFGILSYTYGTNGYDTPKGKDYLVNRIDSERIKGEIGALKNKVDFVIVSMHWGSEYELIPNEMQKELSQNIAEAGGDIIFGHHPHVIQPYEKITTSSGKETHVFYSLGNFFSAQPFNFTNIGGIAKIEIRKQMIDGKKMLTLENPSFVATAVMKGDPYTVNLLKEVENQIGKTDKWVQQHVFGE